MTPAVPSLRTTPLAAWHRAHGARMEACAGWELPFEYGTGLAEEHLAVRTGGGLFDLSHMGQIELAGRDALAALQLMACNDASQLSTGQLHHSALTTEAGTFVDDLLVHRLGVNHYLLVVNAANTARDVGWIRERTAGFADVAVVDTSARYAWLAIEGPAAHDVLQGLTGVDLAGLGDGWFAHGEVAGARATISRTGSTGEDGFGILVAPAVAPRVWDGVLQAGTAAGVVPAGHGARETLRLEAGVRRHGQDIDESTTVLEAGLESIVGWGKGGFTGRAALEAQQSQGLVRRFVGFELLDLTVARRGDVVYADGVAVGTVTGGARTPFLDKAIGTAYVSADRSETGTLLEIDVEGRRAAAQVVRLPFYTRPKR